MTPDGCIDFAVNVFPGGPPAWLSDSMHAALSQVDSYPDEQLATQALAERHGRPSTEVLVTNGAAEAFWLLASSVAARLAVVVHPTFTEAEAALVAFGRRVMRVQRESETFRLDPESVPEDADLVVLGNPNNPTANLDEAAVIERLARPGRVLVVDEAFIEFVPGERASLAHRSDVPGLIVLRSITKMWSVPGIRAGYMLGATDVLSRLRETRQPWSVNVVALEALRACAGRSADGRLRTITAAREQLIGALREIEGVEVWPSVTNFVLVRVSDGAGVHQRLKDRGFALRPASTFPGLSCDHLRIAVRTTEDNEMLVSALRASVGASR